MLKVGDKAAIQRTFSTEDLLNYQEISKTTSTDESIPEPLIGALFSYLLGEELPGYGTNYLKQEMKFHHCALVNDDLRAEVEVIRIRPEKQLVDLKTSCKSSAGTLICSGRALVLAGLPRIC